MMEGIKDGNEYAAAMMREALHKLAGEAVDMSLHIIGSHGPIPSSNAAYGRLQFAIENMRSAFRAPYERKTAILMASVRLAAVAIEIGEMASKPGPWR